jgi:hypothetical protein
MLGRLVLVAVVGFLAGAVVAAEPWQADPVPVLEPAPASEVHDVLVLARLRWLDNAARGIELGRSPR